MENNLLHYTLFFKLYDVAVRYVKFETICVISVPFGLYTYTTFTALRIKNMDLQQTDIFQRLLKGEAVPFNDPDYFRIIKACNDTRKLLTRFNAASEPEEIRNIIGKIIGFKVDATTMVFPPFQINYGRNTKIGKGVFINFDCTFLDLGGITIDDNVMLAQSKSVN